MILMGAQAGWGLKGTSTTGTYRHCMLVVDGQRTGRTKDGILGSTFGGVVFFLAIVVPFWRFSSASLVHFWSMQTNPGCISLDVVLLICTPQSNQFGQGLYFVDRLLVLRGEMPLEDVHFPSTVDISAMVTQGCKYKNPSRERGLALCPFLSSCVSFLSSILFLFLSTGSGSWILTPNSALNPRGRQPGQPPGILSRAYPTSHLHFGLHPFSRHSSHHLLSLLVTHHHFVTL